jgi:hypothetical protein
MSRDMTRIVAATLIAGSFLPLPSFAQLLAFGCGADVRQRRLN